MDVAEGRIRNILNSKFVRLIVLESQVITVDKDLKVNFSGDGYLEAVLVSKPYLSDGTLDDTEEDKDCDERRDWTVTHDLIVNVNADRTIVSISVSNRVWGDSGLGDYDPRDFFSKSEYFSWKKSL